jgi:pyruvate dehydrogenase E1 component alpha subunit
MTSAGPFSIPFIRFLNENGHAVGTLPSIAEDPSRLMELYRAMVVTRAFDEKAVALQRTGRLGTFASSLGQEAVVIGLASAMQPDDVLLPSFREQGAMMWRGVTMTELLLYWGGDERGSNFAASRHDFPICIPVASQFPHAVGVSLAFRLRGERRVAVAVGGDGATSKGDFYEALNIAGLWKLPTVFIINNNQWAISVPRCAQSAAKTLAQKAFAAGISGVQTDGNDVIAVHEAVAEAISRARSGLGPTLIEALTYRLSDHTTADDARRYRSDDEVSPHWHAEPIARMRAFLVERGVWGRDAEASLLAECTQRVEQAADAYLAMTPPAPTDMLDFTFAKLPPALRGQRARLAEAVDHG